MNNQNERWKVVSASVDKRAIHKPGTSGLVSNLGTQRGRLKSTVLPLL